MITGFFGGLAALGRQACGLHTSLIMPMAGGLRLLPSPVPPNLLQHVGTNMLGPVFRDRLLMMLATSGRRDTDRDEATQLFCELLPHNETAGLGPQVSFGLSTPRP